MRSSTRAWRADSDEGISFRYAPKRFALRAPLGLRSSRCPHRNRGKENHRTVELTLQHKVLFEKADTSRVNKSGHFHVLPTAFQASLPGQRSGTAMNKATVKTARSQRYGCFLLELIIFIIQNGRLPGTDSHDRG